MGYKFSKNLQRTIDISRENFRQYFKTDLKLLIKPLVAYFLVLMAFFAVLIFPLSYNFQINITLYLVLLLITLILTIAGFLWFGYIVAWLTQSKAVYVMQKYENPSRTYREVLEYTKDVRARAFFGTLITGFIVFAVIFTFYIAFVIVLITSVFLFINSQSTVYLFVLIGLTLIFLILFVFIFLRLIPLSLYPTVLMIEKDKSYGNAIRRAYEILPGWKNRVKFIVVQGLLSYIVSLVGEFLFFGLIFGSIIASLIIFSLIRISPEMLFILIFLVIVIVSTIFLIGLTEIQNIVLGSFYGQSYVDLVRPDLLEDFNNTKYKNQDQSTELFCTNCGHAVIKEQQFCQNCGTPLHNR